MRFAGTQLSNFMGDTTDFSQIAGTASNGRRLERQASMRGEAMVSNTGVQSLGKIKSAGFQADSIVAQGQAQGQAAIASGIGSMVSGLAGGISSMGSSTGGGSGGVSLASNLSGRPFQTDLGGFTPSQVFSSNIKFGS